MARLPPRLAALLFFATSSVWTAASDAAPATSGAAARSAHGQFVIVPDLQYIPRTYFFIADRPLRIDPATLRVFKDDLIPSNNVGSEPHTHQGIARLDPTAPLDSFANPQFAGNFSLLDPETDYAVIYPWPANEPDLGIPVIRLSESLGRSEVLAVTYTDLSSGSPVSVGDLTWQGNPILGVPPNTLLLKMTKPTWHDLWPDAYGMIAPVQPWYPALFYEARNFYDIGLTDIPLDRLTVVVRRITLDQPTDDDDVNGVPLIQVLGLDQAGSPSSSNPSAPDGRIDRPFIDTAQGILFFPDLHPFDPDTRAAPECASGFGGFLCLDHFARNVLRRAAPWESAANPNVYYKRSPNPAVDSRYYLEASLDPLPPPGGTLRRNVPNPFNPGTTIEFQMRRDGSARLTIFDVQGKPVVKLLDTTLSAGPHTAYWSGDDATGQRVASGVYFCVLHTEGGDDTMRLVLAR